jgi:exodeoxyribonuclease VII large subunit
MDQIIQYTPIEFVEVFNQSTEYAFPVVVVEGEISSFRIAKNRWVYFDIKDETATLRCFGTVYMLPGPLEDPQFNFSLNIQSIVPVGEGAIAKQAELVYKKLEAEGIFATSRKRSVPYPPSRIALISSHDSAAYADYLKISRARWPQMAIVAYDVLVQGSSAPGQIVGRLIEINQSAEDYDAIIIIRGGGSVEDLASFNDERVVRAISASRIPTSVAIGHEVDESLAELACDLRASTPSNLAELMLPDRQNEQEWLKVSSSRLAVALSSATSAAKNDLKLAGEHIYRRLELLLQTEKEHLLFIQEKLGLLNPREVLKRGYSLIKSSTDEVITRGSDLHSGDDIAIIFIDITKKARIL